jgi:hypothetical protein
VLKVESRKIPHEIISVFIKIQIQTRFGLIVQAVK